MASADECFECLAVLLENGQAEGITAGFVRGRFAQSCPDSRKGRFPELGSSIGHADQNLTHGPSWVKGGEVA